MSTAVTVHSIGGSVRPAHFDEVLGDMESNIKEKISIPRLSVSGKMFTMIVNGESTVLTKTDPDTGERSNLQFANVVVVAMNPNRSRTFFAKGYVKGENQAPACYSSDGLRPDKDIKAPQSATCAACPKSVKGSKISDNGKETYACDVKKRLAVWPEIMLRNPSLNLPVMQMVLPITSIWDKQNSQNDAEGWFAWDNYVDDLRARGAKYTGEVVTRIKFDDVDQPKLLFKAVRWLDDAEHHQFNEMLAVKGVAKAPDTLKLLNGKMYEEGEAPAAEEQFEQLADKPKAEVDDDDDGFGAAAAAIPAAKAEPEAKPKAEPKAKAAAKPKAEPKQEAAASKPEPDVAAAAPSDALAALAAEWDM